MKNLIKTWCLFLASTAIVLAGERVEFTGKYEQSFDALPDNSKKVLRGGEEQGYQAEISELPGWYAAKIGGAESQKLVLSSGEGDDGRGMIYSFGHGKDVDRSLGSLSTENISIAFGVALVNKMDKAIESLEISFVAEVWRSPSRQQSVLQFTYGLSGEKLTSKDFLSNPEMLRYEPLDLVGPPTGRGNVMVDGRSRLNQREISGKLTNLNWQPGQTLFLCWSNINTRGAGSAMAMNNLVIEAK